MPRFFVLSPKGTLLKAGEELGGHNNQSVN